MRSAILLLLASGCVQIVGNQPPVLTKINGEGKSLEKNHFVLEAGPDDTLPIALDVWDPEGHDVRVYFPLAPGGIDFDPDAREGVWHLDEVQAPFENLWIVLEDDAAKPERSEWLVLVLGLEMQPVDSGL